MKRHLHLHDRTKPLVSKNRGYMFRKEKESYDNDKISVNIYIRISLLLGSSALPAICAAVLHDSLQDSLILKVITVLQYHMTPFVF